MKAFFLALALLIFASGVNQTSAAEPVSRWNHTCFTTDGTPEIVSALRDWGALAGVTDCGISPHPDIWLSHAGLNPASQADGGGQAFGTAALFNTGNFVTGCEVAVLPVVIHNRNIFRHEVGHCLGLTHDYADSLAIMAPSSDDSHDFRPDDIAAIQKIYGPRKPLHYGLRMSLARDD